MSCDLSDVDELSAFDTRAVLRLDRESFCFDCMSSVPDRSKSTRCDLCGSVLCDESCALAHSIWCSSHSKVLGNLFDAHLCRYYAVHEAHTRGLKTGDLKKHSKTGFPPVTMTALEKKFSSWCENTVCIDVECLFFALANYRFPIDRYLCDHAHLFWHVNMLFDKPDASRPRELANYGVPYPTTVIIDQPGPLGRRVGWYEYDIREALSVDIATPMANVAYLIRLTDCSGRKKNRGHSLILRICGLKAFLVQAYVKLYTFDEWCDWSQPLRCLSTKHCTAKASGAFLPQVDEQPKFRGIMTAKQLSVFGDTLHALMNGEQRDECWRNITGVHEKNILETRVSLMRMNLLAPKI